MAKRNQYNRPVIPQHTTFTKPTTAQSLSFLGGINFPMTGTISALAVSSGSVVTINGHDGFNAGKVTLTNVTLNPQEMFTITVNNSSIPASEVWLAFPQLSGPTGSYANLSSSPNDGAFHLRVASQTDTIAPGDAVEVSYFLVRSADG